MKWTKGKKITKLIRPLFGCHSTECPDVTSALQGAKRIHSVPLTVALKQQKALQCKE